MGQHLSGKGPGRCPASTSGNVTLSLDRYPAPSAAAAEKSRSCETTCLGNQGLHGRPLQPGRQPQKLGPTLVGMGMIQGMVGILGTGMLDLPNGTAKTELTKARGDGGVLDSL